MLPARYDDDDDIYIYIYIDNADDIAIQAKAMWNIFSFFLLFSFSNFLRLD